MGLFYDSLRCICEEKGFILNAAFNMKPIGLHNKRRMTLDFACFILPPAPLSSPESSRRAARWTSGLWLARCKSRKSSRMDSVGSGWPLTEALARLARVSHMERTRRAAMSNGVLDAASRPSQGRAGLWIRLGNAARRREKTALSREPKCGSLEPASSDVFSSLLLKIACLVFSVP